MVLMKQQSIAIRCMHIPCKLAQTSFIIQMILLYEIGFFFIFLFSILSNIVHYIFCVYQIAHNVEQLTGLSVGF